MGIIAQLARPSLGIVQEINSDSSIFPHSTATQGTVATLMAQNGYTENVYPTVSPVS